MTNLDRSLENDRRSFLGTALLGGIGLIALTSPFGKGASAAPFAVSKSPADWRKQLGPQRFSILREAGTERPFTSPLNDEHRSGLFACAGCAQPAFPSTTKFDSGTGWPSFWRALPKAVVTRSDRSLMMARNEVLCSRCGGHLGHVFNDGPKPTGLRYCMNGLALRFMPARA